MHGENVIFRKQAGVTVITNKHKPRLSRSPNSVPGIEKIVGLRKELSTDFRGFSQIIFWSVSIGENPW
jgi:hypothetical protein